MRLCWQPSLHTSLGTSTWHMRHGLVFGTCKGPRTHLPSQLPPASPALKFLRKGEARFAFIASTVDDAVPLHFLLVGVYVFPSISYTISSCLCFDIILTVDRSRALFFQYVPLLVVYDFKKLGEYWPFQGHSPSCGHSLDGFHSVVTMHGSSRHSQDVKLDNFLVDSRGLGKALAKMQFCLTSGSGSPGLRSP